MCQIQCWNEWEAIDVRAKRDVVVIAEFEEILPPAPRPKIVDSGVPEIVSRSAASQSSLAI
ncbi:MAG: hypothetical protein R3C03_15895 [Pirellulaceae bacterium]